MFLKWLSGQGSKNNVLKLTSDNGFLKFCEPVGCESAWYAKGHRFDPDVWQHSFMDIGHEVIFYGHSLLSADSRRAVVSFCIVNVH